MSERSECVNTLSACTVCVQKKCNTRCVSSEAMCSAEALLKLCSSLVWQHSGSGMPRQEGYEPFNTTLPPVFSASTEK